MEQQTMKANVGNIDRALRIVLGLVLLSLVVVGPKTLWGLVGLVPLATGLMRFCPVYPLLGISTCPRS
jgi:hypothetical protein